MLKRIIYKWGSQPKRSLKFFLAGLGGFALAALLIGIGYYYHFSFQIAGILIGIPAFLVAIYGYVGLFANRFAQVLDQTGVDKDNDPFA